MPRTRSQAASDEKEELKKKRENRRKVIERAERTTAKAKTKECPEPQPKPGMRNQTKICPYYRKKAQ